MLAHQARAFRLARRERTLGAFLQMRLGKTLLASRWAASRPIDDPRLIVCPKSCVVEWATHLASEGIEAEVVVGTSLPSRLTALERAARRGRRGWVVTNWSQLTAKSIGVEIARVRWGVVVLDESVVMKSARAKVTKAALRLGDAPFRAILSGLPDPERAEELVTQMLFLRGEVMGCSSFWAWQAKYTLELPHGGRVLKRGAARALHDEVAGACIIMNRRDVGMVDSPETQVRTVTAPKRVVAEMRRALDEWIVDDGEPATNKLEVLTYLHKLAGGCAVADGRLRHDAKLAELLDLARGQLRGEQIVVWARFNEEVDSASRALRSRGLRVEVVTGQTLPGDRHAIVRAFDAGRVDALALQTAAMSKGVDLSAAGAAVYFSNYMSNDLRRQSMDRLVHPRKSRCGVVIDIVAEGSVDEPILAAIESKHAGSIMQQVDAWARERSVVGERWDGGRGD